MRTGKYWVGQIPDEPLTIEVLYNNGTPVNLTPYTDITLRMVNGRGEEVDVSDGELELDIPEAGMINFNWPRGESLFTHPGEYVLRLELTGEDTLDFTSQFTILVREFAEVIRK